MELRGVIADTGTQVFHRGPYIDGTNNIGEFLAIVLGLAYLQQQNLPWALYSDSKTAIAWVRQKQCKTKSKVPKLLQCAGIVLCRWV
jgi:ribonuclease HI